MMGNCENVCLDMDVEESYEDYVIGFGTRRKPMRCCECAEIIPANVTHEIVHGRDSNGQHTHHTCIACADIAASLSCGGIRCHGGLWEAMEYLADEHMLGLACLNKLKTAAGKIALQNYINELAQP